MKIFMRSENLSSTRKISFLLVLMIFGITSVTKVDAYIPVTYVCCYNYSFSNGVLLNGFEDVSNSGILLDNFGNISNWTVGGKGASQQVDTVNYIDGNQGLKLIVNGSRAYTDKVINNNFSNANNFMVWLYVYNVSTIDSATMYLASSDINNIYFSNSYYNLKQGWNKLIFNKGDFKNTGGENWNNIMNKVRLEIRPIANSTNATFDNLRYNMTDDWVVGGSGASIRSDTINFIEGKQGVKLIATNGTARMDLPINNNFSTTNNFAIWTYIDNASNEDGIALYLTSNGSDWNTYFYGVEWNPNIKTGWNHLIFNKHNFKNIGGENWNNIMNKVRLRIYPINTNLNVTFDDLTFNMSGQRAKIMFDFDDGDLSPYQKAFPILNANNQSAVAFIVTSWIGGNGIMNFTNLKTLQSAGWDISSHSVNHPFMKSLDDLSLTKELNDSYQWLVANGFQKSAGFFAYPYGSFNDNVINKTQQRYIFGRGTVEEASQQYTTASDNTIQYIQRVIDTSNKSVQSIEDKINDSINARLLSILYFHQINDTNPTNDPYTLLTADFKNISDYVKSRSVDIDVITYSDDYVISQINNFTPVINKITRIYSNGSSIIITKNKYDEYMPNATIIPSSDYVDINITTYDQTGGSVKFNESSPNNNIQVSYSMGDRIPNWLYSVNIYWTNGTLYQNFSIYSNSTGYISYNSAGFQNSRYQDIKPQAVDTSFTMTLPIGYTVLRFNANNSTVNNLNPDGQTDSQPFFNIMNSGNINQSYTFYLNFTPTNITTYADLNNDFSSGKIQVNTSNSTIVVPSLESGNNQNIWMVIDTNHAPPMNTNSILTISIATTIPGFISNDCDQSLWNHVWGENQNLTYRLLLNTTYPCIKVAGTIDSMKLEDDGDYHINLNLDSQYSFLLNQSNFQKEGGDLVIEVICANSNKINETECSNFNQSYLLNNLSNGVHINVTGAYVTDVPLGFNEIHPITSIGPVILNKVANKMNYSNVGDIIQYTYNVKNVGNVELSGLIITDNKTGIIPCTGILSPGQSIQCSSNYTIVQGDINNGSITNSAFISILSNGTIVNSNLARVTTYKK